MERRESGGEVHRAMEGVIECSMRVPGTLSSSKQEVTGVYIVMLRRALYATVIGIVGRCKFEGEFVLLFLSTTTTIDYRWIHLQRFHSNFAYTIKA